MKKKILLLLLMIPTVGTAIWFFMTALEYVIFLFRDHWIYFLFALPLVALIHGYFDHIRKYHRLGDTSTIVREIYQPQKHIHWLLAPWILFATLIFHLFGASVGRESTAVQMGGSLAETLGRLLRAPVSDRPLLIRMGLAAGFGAAFGVPVAAGVFAMESAWTRRREDWLYLPFYFFASWGADRWTRMIGLHHSLYQNLKVQFWEISAPSYLGLALGLIVVTLIYEICWKALRRNFRAMSWWIPALVGSILILGLTLWVGEPSYNNLGTSFISLSFERAANLFDAMMKLLFTLISTTSGMKGGEVTPLMSAGSLFGSWMAHEIAAATFQLGAAIGLVTLFTSRLRIPLTGIFMLWEIFDWKIALLGAPILLVIESVNRQWVSKLF